METDSRFRTAFRAAPRHGCCTEDIGSQVRQVAGFVLVALVTVLRGREGFTMTLLSTLQRAVGGYFGLQPPTALFSIQSSFSVTNDVTRYVSATLTVTARSAAAVDNCRRPTRTRQQTVALSLWGDCHSPKGDKPCPMRRRDDCVCGEICSLPWEVDTWSVARERELL